MQDISMNAHVWFNCILGECMRMCVCLTGGLLTGGGVVVYNQSRKQGLGPVSDEPSPPWLHELEQRCQ